VADGVSDNFQRRALFVIGISALVIIGLAILWYASRIVLLAFAGVLLGILLHALARWLRNLTGMAHGWSVAIVVMLLTAALATMIWLAGARLVQQGQELARQLPEAYDRLRDHLSQWPVVGQAIDIDEAATATQPSTQPGNAQQLQKTLREAAPRVASTLGTMVGSLVQGVVTIVVITVVGIYVAATPLLYARGLVRMVPRRHRGRAREVVATVVYTLRYWLIGQGITMAVIGTLTAVGLYFIGVEMWLLFGVLAGAFNFIPNFGPLISFIPAVLVAWADDPGKAAWVVGLYVVAQSFEGYVLTPIVQRKAADTPPAVLIVVQVMMGVLAGAMGVMLAAPAAAMGLVLYHMLYIGDALEDRANPAEDHPEVRAMVRKLEKG
jgi:predicted PurR-regulated permease PerM